MHGQDERSRALKSLFQRKAVVTLKDLRRSLGATSRTTVLGALQRAGYYSSYSHTGRYYTLLGIPRFDTQGLWFYEDVGFSVHGTLRATLERLIQEGPAGHTHEELQAILRLRVHDTLRDLVEARRIARETVEALYVYLDVDPKAAKVQLARRHELHKAREATSLPPLDWARVIDVLLTVIREPRAGTAQVAAALRKRGLGVTDAQVEEVFRRYDLGKKTARSRSRPWRR